MRFVLDASIACAWYLKNQATPYSIAVYDAVTSGRHHAIVPEIWRTEVAHVLIRAIGRPLITRADTNVFARYLLGDDPSQSQAARRLLEDAKAEYRIPITVVLKLAWVLTRPQVSRRTN